MPNHNDNTPDVSAITRDLQALVDEAARRVRGSIDRVAAEDGQRAERGFEAKLARRIAGLPPARKARLAARAAPRLAARLAVSREVAAEAVDIGAHRSQIREWLQRWSERDMTGVGEILERERDPKVWRPESVALRVKRVTCRNPTLDASRRDEIKIAAIGHDIYRRRDQRIGPIDLGKFSEDEVRAIDRKLAGFAVLDGMWSDCLYLATIFLAEADKGGGMEGFIAEHGLDSQEMLELIAVASASEVFTLMGVDALDGDVFEPGRIVSALGLGIGSLLAVGAPGTIGVPDATKVLARLGSVLWRLIKEVVVQIFRDWIADMWEDDNFPPQVVQLHLGAPDGAEPSARSIPATAVFRLEEEGLLRTNVARYDIELAWEIEYARGSVVSTPPATEASGAQAIENLDKIEHIVVVMLENRSFDHMLGFLTADRRRPGFDDPFARQKFCTVARDTIAGMPALKVPVAHCTDTQNINDPGHEWEDVLWQVARVEPEPGDGWPDAAAYQALVDARRAMGGFAENYLKTLLEYDDLDLPPGGPITGARLQKIKAQLGDVMNYHPADHVPTFDLFATEFAVCDRWFSSFPGNTWVNRTIALSGGPARKNGSYIVDNTMPFTTPSMFRILDERRYRNKPIEWAFYAQDVPSLLMVDAQYARELAKIGDATPGRLRTIERFFADAEADRLPHVSWLDPNFVDIGDMRENLTGFDPSLDTDGYKWAQLLAANTANDDHPPTDVSHGQNFLLAVFLALFRSKAWSKTMLVVTYDEHGGFHDHVTPPYLDPAIAEGPQFRSLGVRVPAMVVSPWVDRQLVSHTQFDHTSILKTILMKFCRDAQGKLPAVSPRVTTANHLGGLLNSKVPRFTPQGPRRGFLARVSDGLELVLSARCLRDLERRPNIARPPTRLQQQLSLGREKLLRESKLDARDFAGMVRTASRRALRERRS